MARYHVRADGSMGVCTAREGNCPFSKDGVTRHFSNESEAITYSEEVIRNNESHSRDRTMNQSGRDDRDTAIESFRDETERLFNKIDGYSASELEEFVKEDIEAIFNDAEVDARIGEVILDGSRSRGVEHDGSDLDFVVEVLDSDLKEDDLFNLLHDDDLNDGEGLEFNGIPVDINPIRPEETGGIAEYLVRAESYLSDKKKSSKN